MKEEVEIVKIPDHQIKILRNILGERIYFFYADKLQVENREGSFLFWGNEFAIAFSTVNNPSDKFRTYINISADYRSSSVASTVHYEFDITISNAPLRQEGSLQFGKLSSLKIFSEPILMIEIYQVNSKEGDKAVLHDCALVMYSGSKKYLLQACQQLVGGVEVILDEAYIEKQITDLKLRYTLV